MSTHSPQLNIRPAWNQTAKLGTQIYQSVWPEDVCSSGRILAIKTSPLSLLCLCLHSRDYLLTSSYYEIKQRYLPAKTVMMYLMS